MGICDGGNIKICIVGSKEGQRVLTWLLLYFNFTKKKKIREIENDDDENKSLRLVMKIEE